MYTRVCVCRHVCVCCCVYVAKHNLCVCVCVHMCASVCHCVYVGMHIYVYRLTTVNTHLCEATSHLFSVPGGRLLRGTGPHMDSTFSGMIACVKLDACRISSMGPRFGWLRCALKLSSGLLSCKKRDEYKI